MRVKIGRKLARLKPPPPRFAPPAPTSYACAPAPREGALVTLTRAARTRSSRPNRDISSTIDRHHQEVDRPEERGAVRPTHWLGISQARTRASCFPQNATLTTSGRLLTNRPPV